MRLFVAAWPTEPVRGALAGVRSSAADTSLRWERPDNWHVTLVFLGSVPEADLDDLVASLQPLASLGPRLATVGPATKTLGRSVLCVPVTGVEELAEAARSATLPFNRSPDKERPFVGHLTMARARRRQPVPRRTAGVPVEASWVVEEVQLVSSTTGPAGSSYDAVATVALAGVSR